MHSGSWIIGELILYGPEQAQYEDHRREDDPFEMTMWRRLGMWSNRAVLLSVYDGDQTKIGKRLLHTSL